MEKIHCPQKEAYRVLMRGLTEMDLQAYSCIPSNMVLIGHHAFPLVMNSRGQVLMAASLYGKGRIVVLGHEAYLSTFPALVENALTWLRGERSDNPSVGVHHNSKCVVDGLSRSSFQAQVVGAFDKKLEVGVYVTDAYSVGADPKDLVAFLKGGGGVLIAGQAWSWAQSHPKENTLLLFEGNKVSGVAGIYFTHHLAEKENVPIYPESPSSWMAVVLGKDFEDDLEFLLQGVPEFDLGAATLSEVLVHGPLSFPIGTTDQGNAFLAGAYYGQGRVIVITHEGLLGREPMTQFYQNAVHWLDEGRRGVVGVSVDHAFDILKTSGLQCEKTGFRKDLSVFVCTAYSGDHMEDIQNFVAEGGGLLIGGHAWYWAQTHCEQNELREFEGNKMLNRMGLSVLGRILSGGVFKAPVPSQVIKDTYHFRDHIHRFARHVNDGKQLSKREEECLEKLHMDCAPFLSMEAHDCFCYSQVLSTLTDIVIRCGMPQVSTSRPVKSPKDHMLLNLGAEIYKVSPYSSTLLPYLIKDNTLMPVVHNHRILVNVSTGDWVEWISTGLYLSPGMQTYVAVPNELVNKGWKNTFLANHTTAVGQSPAQMKNKLQDLPNQGCKKKFTSIQIGCQTDRLKHDELKRAPCVHEQFPITTGMMQVCNLWGGLIYLVAPPKTQVEGAKVIVQVAVPVPYYKHGVTTAEEWSLLRTAPSPWAELEFDNIIMTLHSDAVRDLEHPQDLAELWNEMMRAIADLAAKPHKFNRKERFVADVQISHGWMHAGYPVMMHREEEEGMVNAKHIRDHGIWGHIHELGHNQQRGCWELPPHTTEGTCNLWSVYVHEKVLGIDREKAHPNMSLELRTRRTKEFVEAGRPLSEWNTWVALETYLQLQEKFGWDSLKKVFAAYHTMSDFPHDNKGKMNLYAQVFSQTLELNLCAYFKAWGWSIERATEEKVSHFPPWSDHPMTQYD